jgi:hypothetical protein
VIVIDGSRREDVPTSSTAVVMRRVFGGVDVAFNGYTEQSRGTIFVHRRFTREEP